MTQILCVSTARAVLALALLRPARLLASPPLASSVLFVFLDRGSESRPAADDWFHLFAIWSNRGVRRQPAHYTPCTAAAPRTGRDRVARKYIHSRSAGTQVMLQPTREKVGRTTPSKQQKRTR